MGGWGKYLTPVLLGENRLLRPGEVMAYFTTLKDGMKEKSEKMKHLERLAVHFETTKRQFDVEIGRLIQNKRVCAF